MFVIDDLIIASTCLAILTTVVSAAKGMHDKSSADKEKLIEKSRRQMASNREAASQLVTRARSEIDQGNYPAAIKIIDEAISLWNDTHKVKGLEENPHDKYLLADIRLLKGMLLYKMRNLNASVTELQKAASLFPDHPLTHITLGVILHEMHQYDNATHHFNITIQLGGKTSVSLHSFLAELYLHLIRKDQKLLAESLENFLEQKFKFGDRPEDQIFLAMIFFLQGQLSKENNDISNAIKHYSKSLAIIKLHTHLTELLTRAYLSRAECFRLRKTTSSVLRVHPGWENQWGERYGLDLPSELSVYHYPKILEPDDKTDEIKECDISHFYYVPQKFRRLNQWMRVQFGLDLKKAVQQFSAMKRQNAFKPIIARIIYRLITTEGFLRNPNVPWKSELDALLKELKNLEREKNDVVFGATTTKQKEELEKDYEARRQPIEAKLLKFCEDDRLIDYYEQHHLAGKGWKPFFQCGHRSTDYSQVPFILPHLLEGTDVSLHVFAETPGKVLTLFQESSPADKTAAPRKKMYLLLQSDPKIHQPVLRPICSVTSEEIIFAQLALHDLRQATSVSPDSAESLYWLSKHDDDSKNKLFELADNNIPIACFYAAKYIYETRKSINDLLNLRRYARNSLNGPDKPNPEMNSEVRKWLQDSIHELPLRELLDQAQGDTPDAVAASEEAGIMLYNSSPGSAYKYLKKAAKSGSKRAMYCLSLIYQDPHSPRHNTVNAMIWYVRAKKAGYLFSEYEEKRILNGYFKNADHLNKAGKYLYNEGNFSEAINFFELGTLLNPASNESLYRLGVLYQRQTPHQNYERAYQYYSQVFYALRHRPFYLQLNFDFTLDCLVSLRFGCLKLYGKGVVQDYKGAIATFKEVPYEPFANAMIGFAERCLAEKSKKDKTYWIAMFYYKQGRDNQAGVFFLGLHHALGLGVAQSSHTANDHFRRAKALSSGDMYWPTFLEWQTELANTGSTAAHVLLGVVYDFGLLGNDVSLLKAEEWYKLAAASSIYARSRLSVIQAEMIANELAEVSAAVVHDHPSAQASAAAPLLIPSPPTYPRHASPWVESGTRSSSVSSTMHSSSSASDIQRSRDIAMNPVRAEEVGLELKPS